MLGNALSRPVQKQFIAVCAHSGGTGRASYPAQHRSVSREANITSMVDLWCVRVYARAVGSETTETHAQHESMLARLVMATQGAHRCGGRLCGATHSRLPVTSKKQTD